ncbi:hypothetical protein GCM10010466_63500 [Planomonospora alba]|uniref:Uncharacterized protein n=1 Tax=Planomonospora alba TaxID=161354 RepID=A0ABP6P0X6_9ACTN
MAWTAVAGAAARAVAEAAPPVTAVPTAAHVTAAAASTLNSLLRMYGFPPQSNGQTAMHDQGAGTRPSTARDARA